MRRQDPPAGPSPTRRRLIAALGAGGLAALGGCLDGGDEPADDAVGAVPDVARVQHPPDTVYVPTHHESMRMLDPVTAGEYSLAPMLSYPHQFWLVDGEETTRVDPADDRGVHFMVTVWDDTTGTVLPVTDAMELRVAHDGEPVGTPLTPWPMLSQGMGFHFGDNITLPGDGRYSVEIYLPPLSVERTGDLAGRFASGATATVEFDYDRAFREAVVGGIEYVDEDYWGEPGALEPMHGDGHGPPSPSLPAAEAYPAVTLGSQTAGDVAVVASLLEAGSRFVTDDSRYLLVSPRTPHNRAPLPDMALAVAVTRDGTTVTQTALTQRVDGAYGLHYGAALEDVQAGDELALTVERPPQISRHQGYETAFFDTPQIAFEVPGP